jgi:CRP/FNR family transcriptional regulator, cyclic AMP receptor protein
MDHRSAEGGGDVDRKELIAGVPLFRSLSESDREALAGSFVRHSFDRGEMIFRQGDQGVHLYLVESGRIKITTLAPDGREAFVAIIGPGQVFGELSLFEGQQRTADARTMEPTVLHALAHDDFRPYVASHPDVAWELLRVLARMVRRQDQAIQDMVFLDVGGRVARRLLDLASQHGEAAGDGVIRIDVPITQEELAQMVGASRESVNKALGSFMDRGWVTLEGRHYIIADAESLKKRLK